MASELVNIPAERAPARPDTAAPSALVLREVARALADGLLLPLHAMGQVLGQRSRLARVRAALETSATLAPEARELQLPAREVRIFVSCAEASGETHAVNFVQALRAILGERGAPQVSLTGLGGARLARAGVRTLGDPVAQARMGFGGVLGALPFYLGLVRDAARELSSGKLDLFVGVDSPALNVPLAHIAKRCGVPTVQYITPQYWAWAPWRVRGYGAAVDHSLSILPFEPAWFAEQGLAVEHVGHPLLDELDRARPCATAAPSAGPVVAVLPGSRRSVIARNLPHMLAALVPLLAADSTWRVRVSVSAPEQRALVAACLKASGLPAQRVEASEDLAATLDGTQAAVSVSGTILIHLLRRRLPAVVLYRLENRLQAWIGRRFLTVPYFSSVNLLAGREVYPEFSFAARQAPEGFRAAVARLLGDPLWRRQCAEELERAAERLGPPGASRRAALAALARIAAPTP
jgi:lipid-A-disaccharide synthase